MIIKNTLKNFLPTRYFLESAYAAAVHTITEIADAVSAAVAATSQTYVDALKKAGSFDLEAQKQAAAMALSACISAISPAAKEFIVAAYGDLTEYLTNKIEAEVRSQKTGETLLVGIPAE